MLPFRTCTGSINPESINKTPLPSYGNKQVQEELLHDLGDTDLSSAARKIQRIEAVRGEVVAQYSSSWKDCKGCDDVCQMLQLKTEEPQREENHTHTTLNLNPGSPDRNRLPSSRR